MFGTDLSKLLASEGSQVPNIVKKCVEQVEKRGMLVEGLYRKSGTQTTTNRFIAAINRGELDVDLSSDDNGADVEVVTSILKQFFRDLPNPLITFEVQSGFIAAARVPAEDTETKSAKFLECISKLPIAHAATLKFLLIHLLG